MLQNAAPTPLGTHEHSRVHFLILTPGLPLLNRIEAEFIGVSRKERPKWFCCRTWPRPPRGSPWFIGIRKKFCCRPEHSRVRCHPRAPSTKSILVGGRIYWQSLWAKRTALFCCRTLASTASGTQASGWFIGGTRRGTALFCCRMRPRPLSTRCGLYPNPRAKSSWGRIYWSHTKRTALFCCRTWPRPPRTQKPPDGLLGAHERNGAVLLQNAAPTPLGTHEHSRVHFLILRSGHPRLNRVRGSPFRDPEIEAGFCHVKFFS